MPKDEILTMSAGRELDAVVAIYVCGWIVDDWTAISPTGSRNSRNAHGDDGWLPYYSTNMDAAWQVIEAVWKSWFVSISISPNLASCCLQNNGITRSAYAETAPLAICRAALLAVAKEAS